MAAKIDETPMTSSQPRRALVVIDVQNEYIDGKFRIEYPPVDSSLPKIAQAMDCLRSKRREERPTVDATGRMPASRWARLSQTGLRSPLLGRGLESR